MSALSQLLGPRWGCSADAAAFPHDPPLTRRGEDQIENLAKAGFCWGRGKGTGFQKLGSGGRKR